MISQPRPLLRRVRLAVAAFWVLASLGAAAETSLQPDLAALPESRGWTLVNRTATALEHDGTPAVRLAGDGGYGFARLENVAFADGTIEFDARGRNVVQDSFLGLAFHGADETTYDAVYFRPFNFRSADPARRNRAVQYVSHPVFTWKKLRGEHPGEYEKPVDPAPDPDRWFHVRIEISAPTVRVFVDGAEKPSLVVRQLSDRRTGWLALWVDVAGGDFANLRITPRPSP